MKPIEITRHAAIRAVQRAGVNKDVSGWIEKQVTEALAAGRVANCKPKSWRLYHETDRQLLPPQVFVWTGDYGFIVAREDNADVVITTFHRTRRLP